MDRAGNEFLTRARFTPDHYSGTSARHHPNLLKHFLKRGLFTDDFTKCESFLDLLVQIVILDLQLLSELGNFFKSTGIGDSNGCLFGEDTDPSRFLFNERFTAE